MRKKISTIFLVLVLILAGIMITPSQNDVKANPGDGGDETEIDYRVIYNTTTYLSNSIYNAYTTNDFRQGRYFGSKGEQYAADYIYDQMYDISLSNVHKERITNVSGSDELIQVLRDSDGNLTSKLDIINSGCTINNTGNVSFIDCYISPLWSFSLDDKTYDKNLLTHNFS
jgi:hypothetical protein